MSLHHSKWIKWTGGECPVADDVFVDVRFHDGSVETDRAGVFDWSLFGPGDIAEYRLSQSQCVISREVAA